jgi:predicted phosphodiesterase
MRYDDNIILGKIPTNEPDDIENDNLCSAEKLSRLCDMPISSMRTVLVRLLREGKVNRKSFETGPYVYWKISPRENTCEFGKGWNAQEMGKIVITPPEKIKTPKKVALDEAIHAVQEAGYFTTRRPLEQDYSFILDTLPDAIDDDVYRIGVVADSQLGSKYQQLTSLWSFYKYCNELGIKDMLHAGDLVDGYHMYRGQEFEVFLHGAKAQTDYAIDHYPKVSGMRTIFIGGNHDESFWKQNGTDVCFDIAQKRPDMIYKGFYLANFDLNGIKLCLHHGDGGVSYARSYKLQKLATSKVEANIKPDIFLVGHFHVTCDLPGYMNMYSMMLPCFQAQTPAYLGRKGLNPDIGGTILELKKLQNGRISVKSEYIPYDPTEDDY